MPTQLARELQAGHGEYQRSDLALVGSKQSSSIPFGGRCGPPICSLIPVHPRRCHRDDSERLRSRSPCAPSRWADHSKVAYCRTWSPASRIPFLVVGAGVRRSAPSWLWPHTRLGRRYRTPGHWSHRGWFRQTVDQQADPCEYAGKDAGPEWALAPTPQPKRDGAVPEEDQRRHNNERCAGDQAVFLCLLHFRL